MLYLALSEQARALKTIMAMGNIPPGAGRDSFYCTHGMIMLGIYTFPLA